MTCRIPLEEMAKILRGHRAAIVEADEWRPLAQHVLDLIALVTSQMKEELDQARVDLARVHALVSRIQDREGDSYGGMSEVQDLADSARAILDDAKRRMV